MCKKQMIHLTLSAPGLFAQAEAAQGWLPRKKRRPKTVATRFVGVLFAIRIKGQSGTGDDGKDRVVAACGD
jgi:hypothetical protein